jgi:hypothetical protein
MSGAVRPPVKGELPSRRIIIIQKTKRGTSYNLGHFKNLLGSDFLLANKAVIYLYNHTEKVLRM